MALFSRRNVEEYTDSLAAYMPGGELFASRSVQDSNFRNLLRGLAFELLRANGSLIEYDVLPDTTEKFLPEWESTLGIPDDCFSGAGTIIERRRDVLVKLASLGVQTKEEFESLAAIFGVTAEVIAGKDSGITFGSDKEARFTLVINLTASESFTYTFPIPFGSATTSVLECLFNKIKPANCQVLFQEV